VASPEAIRIIALQNVLSRRKKKAIDTDFQLREVFRWYSTTFHTPLHVVETLPLDDIFTHYWEAHYLELDEKELEAARSDVLADPDELKEMQKVEDENDLETHLLFQDERRRQAEQKKKDTIGKLEEAANALKGLGKDFKRSFNSPESELIMGPKNPPTIPPDVQIVFADEDLDLDVDGMGGDFGLLAPPKPKK